MGNIYDKLWNMKKSIIDDISKLGDQLQIILPVLFLAYSAIYQTNHQSTVFACTFLIGMVICSLLKALFNAPRPREVAGNTNPELDLDWSVRDGNSFPSGHTMSAMLGAMFWFNIHPLVGILGLVLAIITGFSRIVVKAHWLRDVGTSAAIASLLYAIAMYWFM